MLLLWCADELDKESLIASEPAIFFTTPHYDGHPLVLVRMAAIDAAALARLLADARYARAPARLRAAADAARPAPG